ncbi:hypothetical protein G7Y89_g7411 [Cudoniella acicularis]|uniref:Uncharacterized protein n=1 Tax=Cudoniella acicularis TaxID=354080 RepID=A0A8H4W1K1_9HELO|nr:hypothetical protein G7Y89_g7411 [Cudoniella acicularis]
MDDGAEVFAELPNSIVGPAFYTTASEVATCELLRQAFEIPTSRIIAWSADRTSPVRAEYILVEKAPGQPLGNLWYQWPLESKLEMISQIVKMKCQLASITFANSGCIYFKEDLPAKNLDQNIITTNPLLPSSVAGCFRLGPLVSTGLWSGERFCMNLSRGPFETPMEYIKALASNEKHFIETKAKPRMNYHRSSTKPELSHLVLCKIKCLMAFTEQELLDHAAEEESMSSILEQFRRGSADGLSLQFIIVWLAGDVFNILGAVLQGVLPTMKNEVLTHTQLILAVYYTLADLVLLCQCFYYRGFTWHDEVIPPPKLTASNHHTTNIGEATERTGLLTANVNTYERERRPSFFSETSVHLNPVVPLVSPRKPSNETPSLTDLKPTTRLQAALFNLFAVLLVCLAGIFGWYVSNRSGNPTRHHNHGHSPSSKEPPLTFSLWGQIFGYICALLYLGSRIPQLILNYRRKSTSGVSVLFFLFACIGNLTYVLSIFAYEPHCHGKCAPGEAASDYGKYIAVNASWLAGSLGTLMLDLGIFAQFFIYRERDGDQEDGESESESES